MEVMAESDQLSRFLPSDLVSLECDEFEEKHDAEWNEAMFEAMCWDETEMMNCISQGI